jgi:hypothetical protein
MKTSSIPTRSDIIEMVAREMYSGRILNNSHRGDVVEMMVLAALGSDWKHVGLGWHPWDLQRGKDFERVRIQVKQTAALQLWGNTVRRTLQFDWKKTAPSYFERDNPGELIEQEGWFCDLFVFGLHDEMDLSIADQLDPTQWKFLVVPVCDLTEGTKSMVLSKAVSKWPVVMWSQLREAVDNSIERIATLRLSRQAEIKNLRGKVKWEEDLETMRLDD